MPDAHDEGGPVEPNALGNRCPSINGTRSRQARWRGRVAQVHLEALRKVERLGEEQRAVGTAANFSLCAWTFGERQSLTRRSLRWWLPSEAWITPEPGVERRTVDVLARRLEYCPPERYAVVQPAAVQITYWSQGRHTWIVSPALLPSRCWRQVLRSAPSLGPPWPITIRSTSSGGRPSSAPTIRPAR